jgi:ABC-type lipoprotein export system ATPase subunit
MQNFAESLSTFCEVLRLVIFSGAPLNTITNIRMFQFQYVKPFPLMEGAGLKDSGIWDTEVSFEKGKNYLVTAPSGKGKSTFLHILYGLRDDYEGRATYDGRTLREIPAEEWAEIRCRISSMVFQDLRLFLDLSVRENLLLKNQLTAALTEDRIRDMAKQLGIGELWDKKASTLSYGQRQRVAIVRGLCQPFDYLFLDEPFSHLDEENIRIASELIRERSEECGAGLLHVSLGEPYFFDYQATYSL